MIDDDDDDVVVVVVDDDDDDGGGGDDQGLKMSESPGSGAARKLLPANTHREFVTISQEIFRVKSPMLCERLD